MPSASGNMSPVVLRARDRIALFASSDLLLLPRLTAYSLGRKGSAARYSAPLDKIEVEGDVRLSSLSPSFGRCHLMVSIELLTQELSRGGRFPNGLSCRTSTYRRKLRRQIRVDRHVRAYEAILLMKGLCQGGQSTMGYQHTPGYRRCEKLPHHSFQHMSKLAALVEAGHRP